MAWRQIPDELHGIADTHDTDSVEITHKGIFHYDHYS